MDYINFDQCCYLRVERDCIHTCSHPDSVAGGCNQKNCPGMVTLGELYDAEMERWMVARREE